MAMSENATLKYIHQDHLSGTSLMTDTEGASLGIIKYMPYGETMAGSVPTDKLFTGQRLDGTGLYYYGARYYDPTIGRFISPDTIVPGPTNPQSFNRYSYCLNNPLKYIDPSGNIVYNNGVNMNGVDIYNIEEYAFGNYGYNTDILVAYVVDKEYDPGMIQEIEDSAKIVNILVGSTNDPDAGAQTLPNKSDIIAKFMGDFGREINYTITISSSMINSSLPATLGHELYHAHDKWYSDSIQEELKAYQYEIGIRDYLIHGVSDYHPEFRSLDPKNFRDLITAKMVLTGQGIPEFYRTLPLYAPSNAVEDLCWGVRQIIGFKAPSVLQEINNPRYHNPLFPGR